LVLPATPLEPAWQVRVGPLPADARRARPIVRLMHPEDNRVYCEVAGVGQPDGFVAATFSAAALHRHLPGPARYALAIYAPHRAYVHPVDAVRTWPFA
jgi:hypothetical protein